MKSSLQDEISQTSATTRTKPSSNTKQNPISQQEEQQALKCPRCDSTNTKFCYYNNYSLTQPRHFCKTCRRYWTKGGALRNVPIGGGCRKNKKLKSSSSAGSSSNSKFPTADFKFFTSGISPSIDFQGLSSSFPRSCFSLDHQTSPTTNYSFMGLNYDNNLPLIHHNNIRSNLNTNNGNLASSIESLSSLNQDLHWKLQQQRLAMIFGDHDQVQNKDQNQKFLQPILFQNLEAPKQDCCFNNNHPRKESGEAATTNGDNATTTEWFFGDNSYDHHHQVSATNTSRNIFGGNNASGSGSWNNNGVVQGWEDLQHFTALP